eukprot:811176-Rhodomonas_salina.1
MGAGAEHTLGTRIPSTSTSTSTSAAAAEEEESLRGAAAAAQQQHSSSTAAAQQQHSSSSRSRGGGGEEDAVRKHVPQHAHSTHVTRTVCWWWGATRGWCDPRLVPRVPRPEHHPPECTHPLSSRIRRVRPGNVCRWRVRAVFRACSQLRPHSPRCSRPPPPPARACPPPRTHTLCMFPHPPT